ncbi:MAG: hypothetical protein CL769_02050 [Chloroflexi bacterium]|nr:hypothetical protein [Chloroflexota bacterium]
MPDTFNQENNLALENSELIEEVPIELNLSKEQLLRKQILQYLYLIDINNGILEKNSYLNIFELNKLTKKEKEDTEKISFEIYSQKDNLDLVIQNFAEEYPVNQLSIVDKSLLRLACWEVNKFKKNDKFNKLVEDFENLGYLFGSDNSNKFIKGVLKSLIKKIDSIYYKTK